MNSERAHPPRDHVFDVNSSRQDTSEIQEPRRNPQEPGFLSFMATNLPSSSSSLSKTLNPSAETATTIMEVGFISFFHRNSILSTPNGDDSQRSPEVGTLVCSTNVSTALCLFDESWEYPNKRKRTEDSKVSCAPRKLSTEARNIERMRIQSREGKEEEKRKDVSTELTLLLDPWTIRKNLTTSDLGHLSRLLLPSSLVEDHILKYLPADDVSRIGRDQGLSVCVFDHDTGSSHQLRLKIWKSSGSYVLIGNWRSKFVCRRNLKEHDEVAFFWDRFASKLHFCVLSRAAADQRKPN